MKLVLKVVIHLIVNHVFFIKFMTLSLFLQKEVTWVDGWVLNVYFPLILNCNQMFMYK